MFFLTNYSVYDMLPVYMDRKINKNYPLTMIKDN